MSVHLATVAAVGFAVVLGFGVSKMMRNQHKMDLIEPDEESINDILDDNQEADDIENWSDFSIEEELPLQLQTSQEIGQKESYACCDSLCQDCSVSNHCSAAQQRDMSAEEIVRAILEEVILNLLCTNRQSPSESEQKSHPIGEIQDSVFSLEDILSDPEQSQDLDQALDFSQHCNKSVDDNLFNDNFDCCSQSYKSEEESSVAFSSNKHDSNNNALIDDFAQALAHEVLEEFLKEVDYNSSYLNKEGPEEPSDFDDEGHPDEDPDELFLVLHPPTHDEDPEHEVSQEAHYEGRIAELEKEVATLQDCVDLSEANAEAAHIELAKEKAKSQMLQHELEQQLKIFEEKFQLEHEMLDEQKADLSRVQEEKRQERDAFQKTIQTLQKSLQDKNAAIKEKEESNSLLRKEAMDLVARFSNEHDDMEQKLDTTRRELMSQKRQSAERGETISKLEERLEDANAVLEQKKHETKKLAKEVKKLKRLLDEEKNRTLRSQRFNKILDHIDNID